MFPFFRRTAQIIIPISQQREEGELGCRKRIDLKLLGGFPLFGRLAFPGPLGKWGNGRRGGPENPTRNPLKGLVNRGY